MRAEEEPQHFPVPGQLSKLNGDHAENGSSKWAGKYDLMDT